MPSSYSPNLRLELIGSGEQAGTWGTTTNTNLGTLVEQAISGRALIVMANADYTLTTATGATDEARNMYLDITSSVNLTATRTVTCPAVPKMYVVRNATSVDQSIIISAGGASVTIANGETVTVVCDGTNMRPIISNIVTLNGTQTLTNKTLTAPVISTISNGGTITIPTGASTLVTTTAAQTISGAKDFTGFASFNNAFTDYLGYVTLGGRGLRKATADNRIEVINNANTAVTHEFFDDGGFSAVGNVSAANLVSGSYTPSLTNASANISSLSPFASQYVRVGTRVMVTGLATISATSGTVAFRISLPIASNITTGADASGTATVSGTPRAGGYVIGDAVNDVLQVFISIGTSAVSDTVAWSATYALQ
jgi:hypothetical protein